MAGNENHSDSKDDLSTFIIANILLAIIFSIGVYLQTRIIIVCKKDKHVTWKIDIWHSVVMIACYSIRILFEFITYIIPSLHQYTGKWFCYFASFVQCFVGASTVSHSLTIAIQKYVYNLHRNLIRVVGEDKASLVSIWISGIFSAPLAALFTAKPKHIPALSMFNCLGKEDVISTETNKTYGEKMRSFFFCGFDDYDDHQYGVFDHVMNVTNIIGCFLVSIILLVVALNIIEGLLYYRIFAFMKR